MEQIDSKIPTSFKKENIINIAFKTIIDNTLDMMFVKDINLVYIAASESFVKMVGKEKADDIINHNDMQIFEDINLAERYIKDDRKLLNANNNLINYIEPLADEDGQHRYGSTSKYILIDDDGNKIGILGITRDITRDYIARQNYQQELKYLFELPKDTYAVSYIDIDDWRIISQRKQLIESNTLQTCYTVESLCQAAIESIVDSESKAAEFYRNFEKDILKNIYESGRRELFFEYQRRLSENSIRWVYNEVRFLTDVDSGHLCAMLTAKDISDEKSLEEKLIEDAKMDKMTKLYNRETTMKSIEKILKEEADGMHVLFMIDVDNFKSLNDTLGHQIGDEFLIEFACQLKNNFRESDIVGRIGGDEFFALMKNVSGKEVIEKKVSELLDVISIVSSNYPSVNLSASIGAAIYPDNAKTLNELYAKADEALYEAKNRGKGQVVFV